MNKENFNQDPILSFRYQLEHVLIPNWFYSDKEKFTDEIKKEEDSIDKIFFKLCYDAKIPDRYMGAFQNSYAYDEENNIEAIIIVCPEVEVSANCKYIFLLFNDKARLVFTYEYEDMNKLFDDSSSSFMICAWDKEKVHRNYGVFEGDDYELLEKIKELFKKEIKNEERR